MTPAMYIFANKGLGMSAGKMAAQVAHAAVEAYRISMADAPERGRPILPHQPARALYETNEVRRWYCGGHYMKLVLAARDSDHIRDIKTYLQNRGFNSALILDEGHTEVAPIVPTALGVEIVDKDLAHVQATFSSFDLYRDKPQYVVFDHAMRPDQIEQARAALEKGWTPQEITDWFKSQRPKRRLGLASLGHIRRFDG